MTPKFGSAVLALALAIALGSPAWAAKVYVPYAVNQEDRGASQRTELLLTNGQPSLAQRVSYRLLTDDRSSTGSAAKSVDLAGGKSLRVAAPVAFGGRGLLEIDAPAGVAVSARLIVTRPGADPVVSQVPVLDARSAFVNGARVALQGLSRIEGVNKTALGVVNLGGKSARCEISVTDAEGNEALQGSVEFSLAPRVQGFQEDLFNLFGAETPAEAVATVSCSEKFWAYAVVSDEATGAAQFVQPAFHSVVESVSAEASTIFQLPGEYLVSSNQNHNWQYNMFFPASLRFRQVKLDFDVYVGNWDSRKPTGTHCLFWLNQGTPWYNMFGYLNSLGTRNLTRLKVNYGGDDVKGDNGPGVRPGNNYHVYYIYDGINRKVSYRLSTPAGATLTTRTFSRTQASFTTNYHRIQFGTQIAPEGPEAKTYGWKFSNFRAEYIP